MIANAVRITRAAGIPAPIGEITGQWSKASIAYELRRSTGADVKSRVRASRGGRRNRRVEIPLSCRQRNAQAAGKRHVAVSFVRALVERSLIASHSALV